MAIKKNFSLTYDNTIDEKIDALMLELQLGSKAKTIIACINKVYDDVFKGKSDNDVNIVTDYKSMMNDLRIEVVSLTNKMLKEKKTDRMVTMQQLKEVKEMLGVIKELSRLDGDVNNIFFNAKDNAKHQIDLEGNRIKDVKNEVLIGQFNHKVTMDYVEKAGDNAGELEDGTDN